MIVNVGDILQDSNDFYLVVEKYKSRGRVWISLKNVKDSTDHFDVPIFTVKDDFLKKVG